MSKSDALADYRLILIVYNIAYFVSVVTSTTFAMDTILHKAARHLTESSGSESSCNAVKRSFEGIKSSGRVHCVRTGCSTVRSNSSGYHVLVVQVVPLGHKAAICHVATL